jgi:thioester reductase-like protein
MENMTEFCRDIPFLATDRIPSYSTSSWHNDPHDIALLQYTSGSTSQPRGVAIRHINIIANARALIDHTPVGATWLPQFHDMGLIGHYLFPIVMGGCSHGMTAADFLRRPALWLRMISELHATFAAAPTFGFEHLLRTGSLSKDEIDGVDLSSLKVLMSGAEPVPPETCRRFIQRFCGKGLSPGAMIAAYGLAEATLAVTRGSARISKFDAHYLSKGVARPATSNRAVELCSCGSPLANLAVTIACPDRGTPCVDGQIGEICVSGESVTPGYWHELTQGASNSLLHTRDLGFMLDGELYVCGRADDVIIRHGQNYYPQDIEIAAGDELTHRGACVVFPDRLGRVTLLLEASPAKKLPWPSTLAAKVVAETGLRIDRIVVAPPRSIARTTSGKLARSETRKRLEEGLIVPLVDYNVDSSGTGDDGSVITWLSNRVSEEPALANVLLSETGIESLQLVQLQLEFEDLLARCHLPPDAVPLDGPLLQSCSCAALLAIVDAIKRGDLDEVHRCIQHLKDIGVQAKRDEQLRMELDTKLPLPLTTCPADEPPECILLTGATGFFGPYLLTSMLAQSSLPVVVLARGKDDEDARQRVEAALRVVDPTALPKLPERVRVWRSDLVKPDLGLTRTQRDEIREQRCAIYHNAAHVDYVRNYATLRPATVLGTQKMLDLAMTGAPKHFHYVSSTFIFGWTRKGVLLEEDANEAMEGLDFGYSQSKWVAEHLVRRAGRSGLSFTVYRPALISIASSLFGDTHDVAARLLAFMIRHKLAVDTPNQLSLVPVDSLAHNLVALSLQPNAAGATYHLTADNYYSMTQLTRKITSDFGYEFKELDIPDFISQLNTLAQPDEPVFPLLDFFTRSAPHIAAMTLKRYENYNYRMARNITPGCKADPSLDETARRLVHFLSNQGWIEMPVRLANMP